MKKKSLIPYYRNSCLFFLIPRNQYIHAFVPFHWLACVAILNELHTFCKIHWLILPNSVLSFIRRIQDHWGSYPYGRLRVEMLAYCIVSGACHLYPAWMWCFSPPHGCFQCTKPAPFYRTWWLLFFPVSPWIISYVSCFVAFNWNLWCFFILFVLLR